MAVFENESNASQDANYREHLNRNWDNGNSAFDNLFGKYNGLLDEYNAINSRLDDTEQEIRSLQGNINALSQRWDKIEEQHNDDIKKVQDQIDQLNNVVFGHVHEINYDKPQGKDQNDYHEVIDKSKNRNQFNKDPVSHELNYSAVNGKHNSIEVDTGIGHTKGEKL